MKKKSNSRTKQGCFSHHLLSCTVPARLPCRGGEIPVLVWCHKRMSFTLRTRDHFSAGESSHHKCQGIRRTQLVPYQPHAPQLKPPLGEWVLPKASQPYFLSPSVGTFTSTEAKSRISLDGKDYYSYPHSIFFKTESERLSYLPMVTQLVSGSQNLNSGLTPKPISFHDTSSICLEGVGNILRLPCTHAQK